MSQNRQRRRGSDQEHRDAAEEHGKYSTPALVNQVSAGPELGLNRRQFLAVVRRKGVPHARVGRLVIVRMGDLLKAIGLAEPDPAPAWSPADVLAGIGGHR